MKHDISRRWLVLGVLLAVIVACSGDGGGGDVVDGGIDADRWQQDAAIDASLDASVDAEIDASIIDGGSDAGLDASMIDAGPDARLDAGPDARLDAGADARLDAGPDARLDAGPDARLDAWADARLDAGADARLDAGPDARLDAGPDAGPGAACDPVQQTGCNAGQKCDVAGGVFRCVPVGPLQEFERCNQTTGPACAAGLTCSPTFFQDTRCQRFCAQSGPSTCRPGDRCERDGTTSDGRPYYACTTNHACNPFEQDCATATDMCTFGFDRTLCLVPAASQVDDGALCTIPQQCRTGSACLPVGGGRNKCFRLCDPDDGNPSCASGVSCTSYAAFGPHRLGACGF